LFFTTLTPRLRADDGLAVLHDADLADVEADAGVELEGVAACRRFGVAVHDSNFLAQLVDEDDWPCSLREGRRRELAQRLAHEARLQAHVRVAHFALDLGLGHERRDGVDDDEVDIAPVATRRSAISSACSP